MAFRICFGCGINLFPFNDDTYTAHELECGKKHPDRIPRRWKDRHERGLANERRSIAAFKGVATRRRKAFWGVK